MARDTQRGPVATEKVTLRRRLRQRRRALNAAERLARDESAQAHLINTAAFQRAQGLALYRAFDGEVSTDHIARVAGHRRVLYARVVPDRPLTFVQPTGWRFTGHGLPVPEGPIHPLNQSTLLVVPGVAFDPQGYRLGLGGGHYDRTLEQALCPSVGLAYTFQLIPQLPREAWDLPVDLVVTDSGTRPTDSEEIHP